MLAEGKVMQKTGWGEVAARGCLKRNWVPLLEKEICNILAEWKDLLTDSAAGDTAEEKDLILFQSNTN